MLAESFIEEARQLAAEQRLDDAEAALTGAVAPLEEALRWGRSDQGLAKDRAHIHRYRSDLASRRGQSPEQELGKMLAAIDEASRLDPDDPSLLVLRGTAWMQRAQYAFLAGAAGVLPMLDQAATAFRQASGLDASDQRTLCLLGMCLYYRAFRLNETGADALPATTEGLAAMQRAAGLAPKDPEVHAVSFLLHSVEATALRMAGKPSAAAWRQSIASAEEALRLKTHRAGHLRPIVGQAWIQLARQEWEEGRDPHQGLERGLQMLDDGYRASPGQPAIAGQIASGRAEATDVLMAQGEDVRPHLDRAVAVVDEVLSKHPELTPFQALRGEMLSLEGQRRELAGEDPTPALAEAQRWLDRAAPAAGDDVSLQEAQGRLPLIQARWWASRGRDPGEMCGRAENRLIPFVARHPESVAGHSMLASCALERASWSRRKGMRPGKVARAGLDQVASALEKEPRDPLLWVLRAHLEALEGDRERARQSLERAWATNARVKASRESRRAEAEITR
jgi:tetratricopeptide (TPR) repeat protein